MTTAQTHPRVAAPARRWNLFVALIPWVLFSFLPFTEQYARESVPEQFWSSPRFKAVNRQLTTMWACVFAAMVPLHVIAGDGLKVRR
jgi:hypothetical protein